jgi:hypothetical protein
MRCAVVVVMMLASLLSAAEKKRKPKRANVEIIEVSARRVQDRIELDGSLKNVGQKPILGLVLKFDLLASSGRVISAGSGPIPEEHLEVGHECDFAFQVADQARAVRFKISVVDDRGFDQRVANPGPYLIE